MRKPHTITAGMMSCMLLLSIGCAGNTTGESAASSGEPMTAGFFGGERHTLPANTLVSVSLRTDVTSASATVGQPVQGEVAADVMAHGTVVIPAGSSVAGKVTSVKPAKRFGGQAMVAVGWDSVTLPNGESLPVEGGMAAYASKETAKDTGAIVGGTLGGAILGKVIGKDTEGAVKGAVIGGGIGTAIASRKGDEAHLPAGTTAKVQTTSAREVPAA